MKFGNIRIDKNRVGTLTAEDFADFFGIPVEDMPQNCVDIVNQNNFSFKPVDSRQRDGIILMILKNMDSESLFSAGGEEGKKIWRQRWAELLTKFKESGCDLDELTPDFFRRGDILRLHDDFIVASDENFRFNFHKFLCRWVFQKYFREANAVYEFGCGSPYNLIELARIYPEKMLYGLDWVHPVSGIIRLVAIKYGYNIRGGLFDMSSPDFNLAVKNHSAFFTSGALEQLGRNFQPYLEFVLAKSPDIIVDIDSFVELYDHTNLLEYLAIKFIKRRNYLSGYITALRELEKRKKIVVHEINKVPFGTLYQNGFSYAAWSPILK